MKFLRLTNLYVRTLSGNWTERATAACVFKQTDCECKLTFGIFSLVFSAAAYVSASKPNPIWQILVPAFSKTTTVSFDLDFYYIN